jgi:hypothetical protein
MKTALRSYHPVPSLQKTDGNVQDAPRIKNCLKAAFLPGEQKSAPPSTPADILARAVRARVLSDFVHELIVSRVESWAYPTNQCRQSDIRLGQLFISEWSSFHTNHLNERPDSL